SYTLLRPSHCNASPDRCGTISFLLLSSTISISWVPGLCGFKSLLCSQPISLNCARHALKNYSHHIISQLTLCFFSYSVYQNFKQPALIHTGAIYLRHERSVQISVETSYQF